MGGVDDLFALRFKLFRAFRAFRASEHWGVDDLFALRFTAFRAECGGVETCLH